MSCGQRRIGLNWILSVFLVISRYRYSGEGENIGTRRGVVKLLELVVILLFWFFDTPVMVICTGLCHPCLSQYFPPTPST